MTELPMPSDVTGAKAPAPGAQVGEPPSVKLVVRLFLIPLMIVAAAVGVMFLVGMMTGGTPTVEEAMTRLKSPGGGRTADWLVGPGSKQRYIDAKAITDRMKSGMTEPERVEFAAGLIDVLDHHTHENEGEVQHFLLLALGRTWQLDPSQGPMNSPEAVASREKVLETLLKYARDGAIRRRTAAILATGFWAGREEVRKAFPLLIELVTSEKEDLDIRLSAVTVLGPLATPSDSDVIQALQKSLRVSEQEHAELVWASALSLAQLGQADVADTILMLLDRKELAQLKYYDRESDPQNPVARALSEQEQQRILINTMLGARNLQVPRVQERLKEIAKSDPNPRVRNAAIELLGQARVEAKVESN